MNRRSRWVQTCCPGAFARLLIVVYDGGVLAPGEVAAITTQDGELAGYAFVKPDEVIRRVTPLLARRIAACVDAIRAGTVISLEDDCPVI